MTRATFILSALLLFSAAACVAAPADVTEDNQELLESALGPETQDGDWCDIRESCCGFPGDRGNELGVGKFCRTDRQCRRNSQATVCSSFENEFEDHKSFFCTMACDPAGPADQCGSDAACTCEDSGLCGCTPVSCIENLPPHCEEA